MAGALKHVQDLKYLFMSGRMVDDASDTNDASPHQAPGCHDTGNNMDARSAALLLHSCLPLTGLAPSFIAWEVKAGCAAGVTWGSILVEAGLPDVEPTMTGVTHYIRELWSDDVIAASAGPSVLLVGPSNAGKSTLLERWITGEFVEQLDSTQGFKLSECVVADVHAWMALMWVFRCVHDAHSSTTVV